jgi:hypothetical protein
MRMILTNQGARQLISALTLVLSGCAADQGVTCSYVNGQLTCGPNNTAQDPQPLGGADEKPVESSQGSLF